MNIRNISFRIITYISFLSYITSLSRSSKYSCITVNCTINTNNIILCKFFWLWKLINRLHVALWIVMIFDSGWSNENNLSACNSIPVKMSKEFSGLSTFNRTNCKVNLTVCIGSVKCCS